MRTKQRVNDKKGNKYSHVTKGSGAKTVIVKPAGYPLKGMFHEYPEPSEMDVFEFYAREQWNGFVVKKGDYLFDRRMFPDFAFKVIDADPDNSEIGKNTKFVVEDYDTDFFTPQINSEVSFKNIIGQQRAKQKCKLIKQFLTNPAKFGTWIPKNILFYGPSGTGKTMMAKALANASRVPFLPVKATKLIGEFVGDGARQIHQLYEKAEELEPCIVFIDEFDAIALSRGYQEIRGDVSEIVNALLTELDGIEERKGICTIAATNMSAALDSAVRSRFEEEIEFSLPDLDERHEILKAYSRTFPRKLANDVDLKAFSRQTQGFSGRDLVEKLLKNALHKAILAGGKVTEKHFEQALSEAIGKRSEPPKGMFA
ncbi:MAG: AAA family ATPase [Candidatus Methanoperedens sp.]|nr:AAA family ATPase [Candidatus Methanoperedens sp.]MCE8425614.1 AAA family ATPase [Candidatus Methanoperedens sp.]MCE8427871.1 AAA family ATPase [Candidatus Methanoperedens sp.]